MNMTTQKLNQFGTRDLKCNKNIIQSSSEIHALISLDSFQAPNIAAGVKITSLNKTTNTYYLHQLKKERP